MKNIYKMSEKTEMVHMYGAMPSGSMSGSFAYALKKEISSGWTKK
jgi:hypothetical protein